MEPIDLPPNSKVSKGPTNQPRVQQVTTGEVKQKRRSLRKQLGEAFVAGDLKTSAKYAMMDIFLPGARDMIFEVFQGGLEKFFFGDGRRRGSTVPQHGAEGFQQYHRAYSGGPLMSGGPARAMSRAARARHNFDEIMLASRGDAEEVINQMFEVLSRYGEVKVADLYDLVGIPTAHTDHKWGWTSLRGAGTQRMRDGSYLLDLPDPVPLG
jgi:hypothetical protein